MKQRQPAQQIPRLPFLLPACLPSQLCVPCIFPLNCTDCLPPPPRRTNTRALSQHAKYTPLLNVTLSSKHSVVCLGIYIFGFAILQIDRGGKKAPKETPKSFVSLTKIKKSLGFKLPLCFSSSSSLAHIFLYSVCFFFSTL